MNFPLRRKSKPIEVYVRPHFYSLPVGTNPVCLTLDRQRQPVEGFLVQANINNTDLIVVSDSAGNALNGLQLDAGRAWMFSVATPFLPISLSDTPMDFGDAIKVYRDRMLDYSLSHVGLQKRMVFDLADFWAVAGALDQNLRVFYTLTTES